MRASRLLGALTLSLVASCGQALAWPAGVPETLTQPVNDTAGMLSSDGIARLEQAISSAYANGQGPQVVVLTVPNLDDRAIEDVSIEVARAWGIGDKTRQDGVLLLLAQKEHRLRIEVGTHFEGVLTDVVSHRIIEQAIVPRLREGDADNAVLAGVVAILQVVAPDAAVADVPPTRRGASHQLGTFGMLALIFFLFVLLPSIFSVLSLITGGRGRRGGFGGGWGGGFGGGGFGGSSGGGGFSGGGGGFSGGGSSGSW